MAMRGHLRYELTKYRKGKRHSVGNAVPGIPYNSFRRSTRHVSGMPSKPVSSGYHHESYMGNMPREYHPRLNSPNIGWNEYDSHEPSHISFARTPPIRTGPSNHFAGNAPGMLDIPADDLPMDELWSMARGISPRPQERPISMLPDEFAFVNGEVRTNLDLRDDLNTRPLPDLSDITDTLNQLEKVLPQDHPDIINLTNAADKLTNGQFSAERQPSQAHEPLSAVEDSYAIDPHEEAAQLFNQQMQILDKSFDLPEPESTESQKMPLREASLDTGTFESAEPVTNRGIDEIVQHDEQLLQADQIMPMTELVPESEVFPQETRAESTLEQIVENEATAFGPQQQFVAEDVMPVVDMPAPQIQEPMEQDVGYGAAPIFDEINQAIDQIQQQIEPDPMQMQYGPPMMPEYMVDPMQQFMADYMMPGFGPMNPGFGPMGPMPMPGPM